MAIVYMVSMVTTLQGGSRCGDCLPGFYGDQTRGCSAAVNVCPDGRTNCDENANCVIWLGMYTSVEIPNILIFTQCMLKQNPPIVYFHILEQLSSQ